MKEKFEGVRVFGQVFETYEYSLFKRMVGNRSLINAHVLRLKKSIEKIYLITIIIVNEFYEIVDGQNRFEAAKSLGFPIRYFIVPGYTLKEVQILNENMKNWDKMTYLNSYCEAGHPEYLKVRSFMQMFPMYGIASALVFLTDELGNRNMKDKSIISDTNKKGFVFIRSFEEGNIRVDDFNLSIDRANMVLSISKYFEKYNERIFVIAMLGIFRIPGYSHKRMLSKLALQPTSLKPCRTVTQYKELLEDIYNYRARVNDRISFKFY